MFNSLYKGKISAKKPKAENEIGFSLQNKIRIIAGIRLNKSLKKNSKP
jgi:hypothetical protein